MFTVTELLPGSPLGINRATAINALGVVVGVADLGLGFVWVPNTQNGTVGTSFLLPFDVSPGLRPVTTSTPNSVSAAGIVVGACDTVDANGAAVTRAFSFTQASGGSLVDLGTFNVDPLTGNAFGNSSAHGIDDFGRIVGWADDAAGVGHIFLRDAATGQLTDLLPGREPSDGAAINNSGVVVGSAMFPDPSGNSLRQAVMVDINAGTFLALGTLFPDPLMSGLFFGTSLATAVSRNGTIVGTGQALPPMLQFGILFQQPNVPFGPAPSEALGASSTQFVEKVVGRFWSSPPSAATSGFVFDANNGVIDLNTQLATPGWQIDNATGINDFGQICGTGTLTTPSGPRGPCAVLLTP